ncbi:MAG: hypothetical protein KDD60_13115, partial [Bdellovibrionales bacterium]|nr:hypothetical protein [Bdellovibrionales bacterium]
DVQDVFSSGGAAQFDISVEEPRHDFQIHVDVESADSGTPNAESEYQSTLQEAFLLIPEMHNFEEENQEEGNDYSQTYSGEILAESDSTVLYWRTLKMSESPPSSLLASKTGKHILAAKNSQKRSAFGNSDRTISLAGSIDFEKEEIVPTSSTLEDDDWQHFSALEVSGNWEELSSVASQRGDLVGKFWWLHSQEHTRTVSLTLLASPLVDLIIKVGILPSHEAWGA